MTTTTRPTISLGDLIVAAFDRAALSSADPRKVAALATAEVLALLRRRRWQGPAMAV